MRGSAFRVAISWVVYFAEPPLNLFVILSFPGNVIVVFQSESAGQPLDVLQLSGFITLRDL